MKGLEWLRAAMRRQGPGLTLAVGNALRSGLAYVAVLVLAAEVSAENGGRFFAILAGVRLAAPATALGAAHHALTSHAGGASARAGLLTTVRRSGAVMLPVAAIAALVVYAVVGGRSTWFWVAFAAIAATTFSYSVRAFGYSYLVADGRYRAAAVVEGSRGVVLVLVVLLASIGYASDAGVILSYGLSPLVVTTLLGCYLARSAPSSIAVASTLGYEAKIGLGASLRAVYESADQLMVPALAGLVAGRDFGIAATTVYALMLFVASFGETLVPDIYRSSRVDPALIRRMAMVGLLTTATAGAAGIALAAGYGTTDILWIALALAPVLLARSIGFLPLSALTARGEQNTRNRLEAAGGGGNIALNLVLIPTLGPLGAAVSSVVAESWMAWSSARALRRLEATT